MVLFAPIYMNISMIDSWKLYFSSVACQNSSWLYTNNKTNNHRTRTQVCSKGHFFRKLGIFPHDQPLQATGGPTFAADPRLPMRSVEAIGEPRTGGRSERPGRSLRLRLVNFSRTTAEERLLWCGVVAHNILLLDRTSCPPDKKLKSWYNFG